MPVVLDILTKCTVHALILLRLVTLGSISWLFSVYICIIGFVWLCWLTARCMCLGAWWFGPSLHTQLRSIHARHTAPAPGPVTLLAEISRTRSRLLRRSRLEFRSWTALAADERPCGTAAADPWPAPNPRPRTRSALRRDARPGPVRCGADAVSPHASSEAETTCIASTACRQAR